MATVRGHKQRKLINMFIQCFWQRTQAKEMNKHYSFTLCPPSIAVMLNFNISKVAFSLPVDFYLYSTIMPIDT